MKLASLLLSKILLPQVLLAILATLIFSAHSINRHLSFNSHALDLGIFTQATFLYSEGQIAYSTLKNTVLLTDHFDPILIIIFPLYKIFPSPILLLFLQSLFVSLTIIPLYLIVKDNVENKVISLLLIITYLTSPLLLRAVSFDFHPGTLALLPLSTLLYGWYFRKTKIYWISFFTTFLFKEEVFFYIFGLGIYQLLIRQFRLGLLTTFLSTAIFYLIKFQLMPLFSPNPSYIQSLTLPLLDLQQLFILFKDNPSTFIYSIFNAPEKISTLDEVFRQFGYLSLLSPLALVTILPFLYLRFNSSLTYLWGSTFHNNAPFLIFLLIGTVFVIRTYRLSNKFSYLFLLIFFFYNLILSDLLFFKVLSSLKANNTSYKYISQSISSISKGSSVSAQTTIVPHLSNREKIYLFPDIKDAEFIILNTSLNTYPLSKRELIEKINLLKQSNAWILEKQNQDLYIFKRKL